MANPGLDAVNLEADDVLSLQRQREIEVLLERLARFRPTKLAIEAQYRDTTWPTRYRAYREGRYTLGRNEIEQVGFRLAARLGLATVTPVDYRMFMSGLTPSEVEPPARPPARQPPPTLSPEDRLLRASTVLEYYRHLNSDSVVSADHQQYLKMLLPDTTTPAIYARTDLVTNWYKRNLRIFTNLNRVIAPGSDRVLLLIGAGHVTILRQLAQAAPYYCVEDPLAYLQ